MSEAIGISHLETSLPRQQATARVAFGWGVALPLILLVRSVVFFVGVLSVRAVHSLNQIQPHNGSGFPWIAFDSHFYKYILLYGYPPGPRIPYHISYFPLFPLASRWLLLPIFGFFYDPRVAAFGAMLTFSNACSIIGLCFVYAWARSITNARTAFIAVALLCLYPGSVFFSAGLTEAPFMMFVAMTLCLLQKQRLYAAAAVSAVATACRPTAVSLAVMVVLWTAFYSWNLPWRQLVLRVLLIGTVSIAGAASYECFLWHRYQRFDAFKASEDKWELENDPIESAANQKILERVDDVWKSPGLTVTPAMLDEAAKNAASQPEPRRFSAQYFIDRLTRTSVWDRGIALAMFGVMIAGMLQKTAIPRVLFSLPLVIFMISYLPNWGLRASCIYRYETASIPLFLVMAIWLSPPRRMPLLVAVSTLSLGVQLYYAFLFSRGLWIG